jgi:Crinkler effector protein N-terminal domain
MASADNPAATMSDNAPRNLWCLVEGECVPFRVTAPGSAAILELKYPIFDQNKNAFRDADLKNLRIWKVSTFYSPA